jgi:hypothetical protein
MIKVLCFICDRVAQDSLDLSGQTFPICQECTKEFGKTEIYFVAMGFVKLALAEAEPDLVKRAALEYRAGQYLGRNPRLTAILLERGFKYTVEVLR